MIDSVVLVYLFLAFGMQYGFGIVFWRNVNEIIQRNPNRTIIHSCVPGSLVIVSTKPQALSYFGSLGPRISCYRPQRSCGQGYVFTRVCDSVHGGVSGEPPQQGEPPPGRENPSPQTKENPPTPPSPGPGRHPPT